MTINVPGGVVKTGWRKCLKKWYGVDHRLKTLERRKQWSTDLFDFLDFLTLEDGTDRLPRNVGTTVRCVISQKREHLIHIAAAAWNPLLLVCKEQWARIRNELSESVWQTRHGQTNRKHDEITFFWDVTPRASVILMMMIIIIIILNIFIIVIIILIITLYYCLPSARFYSGPPCYATDAVRAESRHVQGAEGAYCRLNFTEAKNWSRRHLVCWWLNENQFRAEGVKPSHDNDKLRVLDGRMVGS
jgi:hypothetical protein